MNYSVERCDLLTAGMSFDLGNLKKNRPHAKAFYVIDRLHAAGTKY